MLGKHLRVADLHELDRSLSDDMIRSDRVDSVGQFWPASRITSISRNAFYHCQRDALVSKKAKDFS